MGEESKMKEKIYTFLQTIPRGKVATYGQIAGMLGNVRLARYVGNVLHQNPDGEKYPCYKVVNSRGELSSAYAFGGMEGQARRLTADGVEVKNGKVDLAKYLYNQEK